MSDNSESAPSSIPSIRIEHRLGGSNPSIPYIITPRLTFLLNSKPTLCWNKVPDVSGYTVRIMNGSDTFWEEQVSNTEVVYSGDSSLEPGFAYLLTVETDNRVSSLDGDETPLAFEIAGEEIALEVQAAVEDINKSELTVEEKAITKARLFNTLMMSDEAIKTLEQLLVEHQFNEESQKATISLTLAKLYGGIGLNLLADHYYSEVIALAFSTENLKVLAEAKAGLAGVKLILAPENMEEVKQLSSQAQATYKELGDLKSARELEERLAKLANRVKVGRLSLLSNSMSDVVDVNRPQIAQWPPCQPWRSCSIG